MARPRLPRYMLFIWKEGKKNYVLKVQYKAFGIVIHHAPDHGSALRLTRFRADNLQSDLGASYEVEPV